MKSDKKWLFASLSVLAGLAGGCALEPDTAISPQGDRDKGLVIILPGIQGNGSINEDIRQGLAGAGIQCAIEIRQWGFLLPGAKLIVNQVNVPGNRAAGKEIAKQIASYQSTHPDRPVYLVGHSGGAGVGVFALEALASTPGSRQVAGLVLLSASVSNDYDLTAALRQSREGIVNFYNEKDVALLGIGTTLLGNVDGGRSPSAGRVGFKLPDVGAKPAKAEAYKKLYQVRITRDMVDDTSASHVADTSRPFVAAYVAEWIIDRGWPPPRRLAQAR
jgi:pimeloyl-ACP methyl ester carboxylesterase